MTKEPKTNVLIWVHDFPAISETFIRNHVVALLDRGLNVFIYTKHKRPDQQEALIGFEAFNLYDKCFSNHDILHKNKPKRFLKAFGILFKSLVQGGTLKYLKSLNVFKYGASALNLQNFYLTHFLRENKIAIVHAHYGFMGNEAVFVKNIGLPVGLFVTFHGVDIREGLKPGNETIYKELFAKADKILSISKYNTQALLKMGAQESKLAPLPNGVDMQSFTPGTQKNDEEVHILNVGRHMKIKGNDLAIRAFKILCDRFPDEKLILDLVGDGPMRDDLTSLARELNLENNIVFHGWQSSSDIKKHYQEARFYLLPSRGEALPTVLLEAQSCALPVVATRVGSVEDMLPEGNCIVDSGHEELLADGMIAMMNKRNQWKSIGERNRNHIVKNYDEHMLMERLVVLYQEAGLKTK